ncbi:ABC transporter ATP-binding protein [Xanthobacter sp. V3C-3]|uniref:ABC transporter ATP-binding protein n=1 Tax=Xanthobacter lutulentifluminis TaxID=3119935 RepID=UPI00372CB3E3
MLKLESVSAYFGQIAAINAVSIEVNEGEFVSIVGPNGAGKTTLFRTISGVVRSRSGRITFEGTELNGVKPPDRAHLGIAHVPEGRQIFGDLTVEENLQVASCALRDRGRLKDNLDRIYSLFPILAERGRQHAGMLSGGQQQMLAIGRALISSPRLLMLDEPSMGVSPALVEQIFEVLIALNRNDGLTVMIVEQRAIEAIEACHRGYVLASGRIVLAGTRDELLNNEDIREAYLGA